MAEENKKHNVNVETLSGWIGVVLLVVVVCRRRDQQRSTSPSRVCGARLGVCVQMRDV